MRCLGHIFLFFLLVWVTPSYGQRCIDKKDLTVSLTGGAALTRVQDDSLDVISNYKLKAGLAFAFDYSFTNRLAVGMRFDRSDVGEVTSLNDRGRITSYSLLAIYRPYIDKENYVEARAGIGTGVTAMRRFDRAYYSRGSGGLIRAGVSWVKFITSGFGLKLDVSGFMHTSDKLVDPDDNIELINGSDNWALSSSVRSATVGLLVKY